MLQVSISTPQRIMLAISYMCSMGVCGLVLVSLGQKLNYLASHVGLTPQEIGTVFVLRGFGAVAGSLLSAALYHEFAGNRIIALALLVIFIILLLLPHNTSFIILHVYFFLLGFSTAITDTGCQIMTRKLHGALAGPWLGANTVAFGLTGAVVPLVVLYAEDVGDQFALLASVVFLICALTILSPSLPTNSSITSLSNGSPNGNERIDRNKSRSGSFNSSKRGGGEGGDSLQAERKPAYLTRQNSEGYHHHHSDSSTINSNGSSSNDSPPPTMTTSTSLLSISSLRTLSASSDNNEVQQLRPRNNNGTTHYYVEVVIGVMVFFIIGGQVTLTAYLSAYVEQMQVIKDSESLMLCFWLLMTLGRLLVIQDLRFVTNQSLPWHLGIFAVFGIAAASVLLLFPTNALCLWIAVPAYGFFNGPLLGYSYDLNNRLTDQSELSTSIIMMFLNLGASVVPFCSSLLWRKMGPRTLFLILFISMAVQPFLLLLALSFSYRKPQKRVRFDGGYRSLEDASSHVAQ